MKIEAKKLEQFLTAKGINIKCSCCGSDSMGIYGWPPDQNNEIELAVFMPTAHSRHSFESITAPYFSRYCMRCGQLQHLSLEPLVQWLGNTGH